MNIGSVSLLSPAIHHLSNANFYTPQFFVGAKNCKSGELIRQNVTGKNLY